MKKNYISLTFGVIMVWLTALLLFQIPLNTVNADVPIFTGDIKALDYSLSNGDAKANCLDGSTVECTGKSCYAEDPEKIGDGIYKDGYCECDGKRKSCSYEPKK